MALPTGEVRQFQALYDSGAEINLIRHDLAKEHELTPSLRWRKPIAGFLDEHRIKLHSAHELTVSVTDIHNCTKVVGPQPFWAADFVGYDLILGYPWLAEADPKIRFKTGTFEWWNDQESEGRISVTNLEHILDDVARGETVYVLHPKEYRIQPLFHGSMGIELNRSDDPSTTDTLRGTAGQVADSCPGGGDLEDLTGYYQRQGLLWLKQYMDNMLRHLQRCVKEFPTLHWLLHETIHRTVASIYK